MAKNKKKMNEAIMWLVAALAIAGVAYGVVFLLTGGSCSKADCSKALWKAGCKKRCGKKEKYLLGNEKQDSFQQTGQTTVALGWFFKEPTLEKMVIAAAIRYSIYILYFR
jgi:hypothetical protein